MNTWPEAPRLSESLNRLADEVRTDTPARAETEEVLRVREAGRFTKISVTDNHESAPTVVLTRNRPDSPGNRSYALAVAATLALVVGIAALLVTRESDPTSTVTADDTTAVQAQPPGTISLSPPPELRRDDLCKSGAMAVEARLVPTTDGDVEIGVARNSDANEFENMSFVVLGPSTDWAQTASEQQIETTSGVRDVVAFYVPGELSTSQTAQVLAAIKQSRCGGNTYLINSGPVADSALCPATFDYSGFALINPGPPPTACELFQPTTILTAAGAPGLADWERHFGCVDGTSRLDDSGNEITSYGECEITLTAVRSAAPDVWSTTIDGIPTAEFLSQVVTTAK